MRRPPARRHLSRRAVPIVAGREDAAPPCGCGSGVRPGRVLSPERGGGRCHHSVAPGQPGSCVRRPAREPAGRLAEGAI